MSRRRCCCGGAPVGLCAVYTVRFCTGGTGGYTGSGGRLVPAGTVVRIRATGGGAVVDEGVTDASGQVTLCVPTSATRRVELDLPPGYPNWGFNGTTNASNRFVYAPTGVIDPAWCCADSAWCSDSAALFMPRVLYLTDANGTWTSTSGCGVRFFSATGTVANLYDSTSSCLAPAPSGVLPYTYSIGASGGSITVVRTFNIREVPPHPRGPATPICGAGTNTATGTFALVDCPDFYVSGALTPEPGHIDPIGGTVVVSG